MFGMRVLVFQDAASAWLWRLGARWTAQPVTKLSARR